MATLVSLALLAAVLQSLGQDRTGVSRANYERIKVGMNRQEVEEIIGRPPDQNGAWDRGGVIGQVPATYATWLEENRTLQIRALVVCFDERGRAMPDGNYTSYWDPTEGLTFRAKLERWLDVFR